MTGSPFWANAGQFGRGLAYADYPSDVPWRYAHLMNSPSGAFGEGFVKWFEANWGDLPRIAAHQPRWLDFAADHMAAGDFGAVFAPRAVFGDYLAEIGRGTLAAHAAMGVTVQQRTALATDLAKDEHGFRITLATGEVIRRTGWTWPPGDHRLNDLGPIAAPRRSRRFMATSKRLPRSCVRSRK